MNIKCDIIYVKNIFGDVEFLLDDSGNVLAQYSYDAWGNCSIVSDTDGIGALNPIRYRSYYYDTESKLYYLMTRYYDPETATFLTRDTVDYLDPNTIHGLDLYAYCCYNPIMYYDPTGHLAWWIWLLIIIGAGIIVNHIVSGIQCAIASSNVKDVYTEEEAIAAIEEILGENYKGKIEFTEDSLKIHDSYKVNSRYKRILICKIYQNTVDENGNKKTDRCTYSLSAEWCGHNLLANLGIASGSTNDVDLDYDFGNNKWYTITGTIILMILGAL